jgi:hypothetical protein
MKEARRSRSTTEEGVFSFEALFSDGTTIFCEAGLFISVGTKMRLKKIRETKNLMEDNATMAAIKIELSSPCTA